MESDILDNKTVVVYTKENCRYCSAIKTYLKSHEKPFYEIHVGEGDGYDITPMELKEQYPFVVTLPAIFVNKNYIGGYDSFVEWMETEKMKKMFKKGL